MCVLVSVSQCMCISATRLSSNPNQHHQPPSRRTGTTMEAREDRNVPTCMETSPPPPPSDSLLCYRTQTHIPMKRVSRERERRRSRRERDKEEVRRGGGGKGQSEERNGGCVYMCMCMCVVCVCV